MMDDKWTNEYAAMWDSHFVGQWAERLGELDKMGPSVSRKKARAFIGMLYKRVGAVKAYPALKAAIEQAKKDPRGYAIRSVSE